MATVQINGVAWDFQNIQVQLSIHEQLGSDSRVLVNDVPITLAFKEINYDGKIETEDMMGSARLSQDTTDGVGAFEANFTLEKWGSDYLLGQIAQIDGHGWATVRLSLGIIYSKPGVDPVVDTIKLARILNPSNGHKAGKDPLSVQYTLKPFRIYYQGKDPFGGPLT